MFPSENASQDHNKPVTGFVFNPLLKPLVLKKFCTVFCNGRIETKQKQIGYVELHQKLLGYGCYTKM